MIHEFKKVFDTMPSEIMQKVSRPTLIFTINEWKSLIAKGVFSFTDQELSEAEKHPKGFIGSKNGIDCFIISKN